MKFGVVFPQTDFGSDPAAIKEFTQAADELGYTHIVAYDHVLGVNPDRPGGWKGPYTYQSSFMEPFVLFSYMAGFTQKLGFLTGILILPQRQTVLVAKQAATLDVLCKGKFRLGVGNGWNEVEYTTLNENFHNRGRRMEEQVNVLRQLWTQPLVKFEGKYHQIPDAGLKPMPVQQPIPIWFGGQAEEVLKRAARIGDGWLPNARKPADAVPMIEKLHEYLDQAGRSRADFGLEARISYGDGMKADWQALVAGWQAAGVNCISINTLNNGFTTPGEHIQAVKCFAEELGIS